MKGIFFGLCAIALACPLAHGEDETPLKRVVKEKAQQMNTAMVDDDFAKIAEFSHPTLVKFMGGQDAMVSTMQAGAKEMKAKGITVTSAKVDECSDPVANGDDLFVVVTFDLQMKVPKGKLLVRSFVIGVSSDKGKSWTFVNGDLEPAKIKQVVPNLPESLKLPKKLKPVLEKE